MAILFEFQTPIQRRIYVVLTRKKDIVTMSYRRHAWNHVEIGLKLR